MFQCNMKGGGTLDQDLEENIMEWLSVRYGKRLSKPFSAFTTYAIFSKLLLWILYHVKKIVTVVTRDCRRIAVIHEYS